MKAVTSPVGSDIGEDDAEADQWDDVGNGGAGSIGDSALDWGEDSSTRNTHDKDTSAATSVASKVGRSECEDGGVHRSLEEENRDQDANGRRTTARCDISIETDGTDRVNREQ